MLVGGHNRPSMANTQLRDSHRIQVRGSEMSLAVICYISGKRRLCSVQHASSIQRIVGW